MATQRIYPELPKDTHDLRSEPIRQTRQCSHPCPTCDQFYFVHGHMGRIAINERVERAAPDNGLTHVHSLASSNHIRSDVTVSENENGFQFVTLPGDNIESESQLNPFLDEIESEPMSIDDVNNSGRSPHHTEPKRLWTADEDEDTTVDSSIRLKCESCEQEQSESDMHYCSLCLKAYCIYCVELDNTTCQCKRCFVLNQVPIRPRDLEQLQARDLKWYLTEQALPFTNDMSKRQLVSVASIHLVRNSLKEQLESPKRQLSQPESIALPSAKDQCTSCNTKFLGGMEKVFCPSCLKQYCMRCIDSNDLSNQCKRCVVFSAFPIDPIKLSELHINDLQWFLISQNIAYADNLDKKQLINLILNCLNSCSATLSTSQRLSTTTAAGIASTSKSKRSTKKSRNRSVKCNSCEKEVSEENTHICLKCGYSYCIMCVEVIDESNRCNCRRCLIMYDPTFPVLRDNLELFNENDLRWYLYQFDISFSPIEKKHSLIQKILRHAGK